MYIKILFLLLLLSTYADGVVQYVSLTGKKVQQTGRWAIHAIWIGELKNIKNVIEVNFEGQQPEEAIKDWFRSKVSPEDSIIVLSDPYNLDTEFVANLKKASKKTVRLAFKDVRPFVRETIKGLEELDDVNLKEDSSRSLDARLRYLVHSGKGWGKVRKEDLYILKCLNFEQLRAYFWATKQFTSNGYDERIKYWLPVYRGQKAVARPGQMLLEDIGVVDLGGTHLCGDGDGIVVDIYESGAEEYDLVGRKSKWTVLCFSSREFETRYEHVAEWPHDTKESLFFGVDEFFYDMKNCLDMKNFLNPKSVLKYAVSK